MARLKPYLEKMTDKPFREVVGAAYMDRVSLVATGFYKMEGITFDPVTRRGGQSRKVALRCAGLNDKIKRKYSPFLPPELGDAYDYFTYGAACIEVEIDTLTGDR